MFLEVPHVVVRTMGRQNQCSNANIFIVHFAGQVVQFAAQVGVGADVIVADRTPNNKMSRGTYSKT